MTAGRALLRAWKWRFTFAFTAGTSVKKKANRGQSRKAVKQNLEGSLWN